MAKAREIPIPSNMFGSMSNEALRDTILAIIYTAAGKAVPK